MWRSVILVYKCSSFEIEYYFDLQEAMPVRDCKGEVALVEVQSCSTCPKLMDENNVFMHILVSCGSVLEKYTFQIYRKHTMVL